MYILFIVISCLSGYSQSVLSYTQEQQALFDSLQKKIDILEERLKKQKNNMDASIYFTQKELEKAIFMKKYEEFVIDEKLDAAIDMTRAKIEESRKKKDQVSVDFYTQYEKRWYEEVRLQRIKYQDLFKSEKNFKKEYEKYTDLETVEGYEKAKRICVLAIKYAMETGGQNTTINYLENYWKAADAREFDLSSPYDLERLTSKEKFFDKLFLPLVESDSIQHIEEAGRIVDHCITYSNYTITPLPPAYFYKKRNVVAAAISDYYDKLGNKMDLSKLTDRAIKLRLDTLNPYGVFKWGQSILVIHYFTPKSNSVDVRRGEAILKADQQLIKYITLNDLGTIEEDDKMGYTFVIPYFRPEGRMDFYFDVSVEGFQYMVCYTMVKSPEFTQKIIKYMPPIQFEEELEANESKEKEKKQQ